MEESLEALSLIGREEAAWQVDLEEISTEVVLDLSVINLDRFLEGSPWTFNNHLLFFHRLREGEDPMVVSLFWSKFWVQVHDLLAGLMSETMARNLFMRKKKLILSNKGCIYARFQYEKLSVFCFLCGRLRHFERFYPARIVHGKIELEFEWDLSVKTIPKRAMVVTSSWACFEMQTFYFKWGPIWAEYGGKLDYDISGSENIDANRDSIKEDWTIEIGKGKKCSRSFRFSSVSSEMDLGKATDGHSYVHDFEISAGSAGQGSQMQ
ncbi:hypothetical protein Goshw_004284 [Gossypium schwendimanii]|uniref:Zinc knuckle CX2CX4HX4C domain-containing protein n=1 Tax=Gossypium schwendimanii TaxID=34291 RepID=A0A7J9KWF8_GOSSC|nr:hypothetical protein [Gossypium schwendimanii]